MADEIGDDEIILRRVPPGTYWQAPGPRVASNNFLLRDMETGVSVSRLKITSPAQLLELVGGTPEGGWKVAAARAGDIRALGLRIIAKETNDDRGHAEIESAAALLSEQGTRRALARLFQFVDLSPGGQPPINPG